MKDIKIPTLRPIGMIHSPFKKLDEIPIQPAFSKAVGEVEVFKEYEPGLKDIEGFSHIILLYLFHKSEKYPLLITPFLDKKPHGVFATRYHKRPNQIGISTVKLLERRKNILRVEGIDVLDATPLLDIKPHVPKFDCVKNTKIGWLSKSIKN
jgi:tRNA-Thr(GGU) m(6)t(6)A37 methyltransferase TsaA